MKLIFVFFFTILISKVVFSSTKTGANILNSAQSYTNILEQRYKVKYKKKEDILRLKRDTLKLGGKAVPVLVNVMKKSDFPDSNRWVATFMLGRIMGKKSSPFISKFLKHPSWIMRMAGLKTLLALKDRRYGSSFMTALNDKSLIVRTQALENIRKLKLQKYAPQVWSMLYEKSNYKKSKKVKLSDNKTHIVKNIIKAVGELKFIKAKKPLLKMIQNKKYKDIYSAIDYSLEKITGKTSPSGNIKSKQIFWSRMSLRDKVL